MKKIIYISILLFTFSLNAQISILNQQKKLVLVGSGETPIDTTTAKILLFTKTAAWDHLTRNEAAAMLTALETPLNFTLTVDDVGTEFDNQTTLNEYDIIFFSNTTGDFLTAAQRARVEAYAAQGGHFIGNHGASDCYGHSSSVDASSGGAGLWDWYAENVTGASQQKNPSHTASSNFAATLSIVNNNADLLGGITFPWSDSDEWYYWEKGYIDNKFTELFEVSSTGGSSWDAPRMMAQYWERPDGGVSLYTGLGHSQSKYSDTEFVQLISNFISYALNYVPPIPTPEVPITSNLADESAYFAAYLLPISQKANLQAAIDTYGATIGVRLEPGNYCVDGGGFGCADTPIVMSSNQKLYGHPSATNPSNPPNITIAAGSTGVELRKLKVPNIVFEAGSPITNCTITSIEGNFITTIGGQLENNQFIDIRSRLNWDCSVSGYLRNNTVLRHQVSAGTNQWSMHGNETTPSYGCMHIAVNILNPWDNGVNISGIEDITIIGLDAEAWNWQQLSPNAMLYMRNMGSVKITDLGGSIAGYLPSESWTPAFDIEADKLNIFNSGIYNIVANPSIITGTGDVFSVRQKHNNYTVPTGYDARVFVDVADGTVTDPYKVTYNGTEYTTPLTSGAAYNALKDGILLPQKAPYDRIAHETLPNPTGVNWATDRIGEVDSHDYIQNLINTNGIAELPEGIFYIGSPLTLTNDQGIIGKGTGKTAIVGLTDNFPLIETYNIPNVTGIYKITVSNMTLQGGESGLKFISNTVNDNDTMTVFSTFDFLIFRNQASGFHLYQIFGMDNHMMNQVSYVDCGVGFHQDPKLPWAQEFATMTYVDKVLFYKNQFINCSIRGAKMNATRANNLDTFYGCNWDGNAIGIDMSATNYGQIINSDFTNHTGEFVIGQNMAVYNCDFTGNTTNFICNGNNMFFEGCNINDNITFMAQDPHAIKSLVVKNSTIAGALGNRVNRAIFMNSSFPNEPSINKLLVTRKPNDPNWNNPFEYTIIDELPTPYPMFLVKY